MQLGMIGLGRMGANMVRRLMKGGHQCVVFDLNPDNVKKLAGEGATGAESHGGFRHEADQAARRLGDGPGRRGHRGHGAGARRLMEAGDTIIDGGNSYYKDDIRRVQDSERQRHPLPGRRHQRRRLGHRARILHDDRRPERSGSAARSHLQDAGSRASATSRAHPGRERQESAPPSTATCTAVHPAPATSSRWSTTASNTA